MTIKQNNNLIVRVVHDKSKIQVYIYIYIKPSQAKPIIGAKTKPPKGKIEVFIDTRCKFYT